ncbi:MAG TPA: hypothetical protein VMV10_15320 [Pirellulales bacterium]|nr:hypothetical protein [Pirellulales bacterium]
MTRTLLFGAAGIVVTALFVAGCAQNRSCGYGACQSGACPGSGGAVYDHGGTAMYEMPAEPAPGPMRRMLQGSGLR